MKVTFFKSLLLVSSTSVALMASGSANLLPKGGEFEKADSKTGWTLDVQSDATGTFIIDSTTGTAHGGKGFIHIEVTKVSSDPVANNWHVQLKDPTYTVKKGYNYHFSMWARSDSTRKAQISVYGKSDYITSSGVDLTTTWAQYDLIVKSEVDGAQGINFALVCGYSVGKYDIDDVVITEEAPSNNIYSNGSFELGSTGWALYASDTSGAATMTIKSDGAKSGSKYCRVAVTKKPTSNWMVQLSDGSWISEKNAEYTFSFWAKTDVVDGSVDLAINAGSSRNYGYVAGKNCPLTSEWTQNSYTFLVDADSIVGKDSMSFNLYCGNAVGNYDIDSVELTMIPGTATKPMMVSRTTPAQFEINILPTLLQCGEFSGKQINNISIFDMQGKLYYSRNIAKNENSFNIPRPVSGSWIIKANGNNSNMSRTIVLP
jgi:hypothetical protein